MEVKLHTNPITEDQEHFHIEIPGQACEAISLERYFQLHKYLKENHEDNFNFTRLDLAFDHLDFKPIDVENALIDGKVRTLAKRESIKIVRSPFQNQDSGEPGTHTVELGSNHSDRMITVYNKRGFTRLEFQTRRKRANLIANQLLDCEDENVWFSIMLAHLLDFVDFETDWWSAFKNTQGRANKKVSSAREVTTEKLVNWIDKQVSPALSALEDAYPGKLIPMIIERGRKKRGKKYDAIFLENHEKQD